jgi:electron transfer flavoprotein beta subunit
MTGGFHIVVCGSIVPDPLQTLAPQDGAIPSLKNEMMLPAVLDPWAGHALFEAANLAKKVPGSKVWLVSLGPKAKLQQLMMTIAQKVSFELVVLDGSASGFTDPCEVATALAGAIKNIAGLTIMAAVFGAALGFHAMPRHHADDREQLGITEQSWVTMN